MQIVGFIIYISGTVARYRNENNVNLNLVAIIISLEMKKGQLRLATGTEGMIDIDIEEIWLGNVKGREFTLIRRWESDIKMDFNFVLPCIIV